MVRASVRIIDKPPMMNPHQQSDEFGRRSPQNAMCLSGVPEGRWCKFSGLGFDNQVIGVVYRAGQATCGLPLGAIGTGHIDLDTDSTLGRCTIFNTGKFKEIQRKNSKGSGVFD
jgi:hypothetical protein